MGIDGSNCVNNVHALQHYSEHRIATFDVGAVEELVVIQVNKKLI